MADMSDYELDPVTGQYSRKKKAATIPYENPTGQGTNITGLTADATAAPAAPTAPQNYTQSDLAQGSANVMGTAQTAAINQAGAPTVDKASEMTMKMMQDPNFGWNQQKNKAYQMSQFDLDRANAQKAFKEQYGAIGGSGQVQENLLNTILQGNVDRSTLENKVDTEAVDRAKKDWMDAITAGQTQGTTEAGLRTQAINNLIGVRGAYEGEAGRTATTQENALDRAFKLQYLAADQQGQKDITELQGKIATGALLSSQDFQSSQNALNRAAEVALQKGDIQGQKEIATLQGELNLQAAESQRKWESGENALERGLKLTLQLNDTAAQKDLTVLQGQIKSGQMLNEQDFTATQNGLNRALEKFKAEGDWANVKEVTNLKANIDSAAAAADYKYKSALQSSDQIWSTSERLGKEDYDSMIKVLDREHETAIKKGDWASADNIAQKRIDADIKMQTFGFDHDQTMAYIDNTYKAALQKNDLDSAENLQTARIKADSSERALDRVLDQAKIALEEKGLNQEVIRGQYDRLVVAEQNGTAPAGSAMKYLKEQVGDSMSGIEVLDPASEAAVNASIDADLKAKRYAFARTHFTTNPEYIETDKQGNKVLSSEGLQAFDEWVNTTMYQEAGSSDPVLKAQKDAQKAVTDPAYYDSLLGSDAVKAADLGNTEEVDDGWLSESNVVFKAAPPANTLFKYGDKLYLSMADPVLDEEGGGDSEYITVRNLKTGQIEKLYARDTGSAESELSFFR